MTAVSEPVGVQPRVTPVVRPATLLLGLLAIGIALRVWQYAADTSMWFDELLIARNVSERSLVELLTRPLGYAQSAPPGFLAALKISALLFGSSDLALRVFPFLGGIAALVLFRRVAERVLDGVAVPVAVAMFAVAIPLIRYTVELKSYGCDAAASLALTLVALDLCERPPTVRRCLAAGGIGVILVWFSQASVMVLAGLGIALVLRAASDPAARRPAMITVPIWAVAAVAGLLVARHNMTPDTAAFMHRFWTSRHGFLTLPPRPGSAMLWTRERVTQFFEERMLRYPWPAVYAILAVLGAGVLWRRRPAGLLLVGPVAVTLVAAVAQQYPFSSRLVLFLLPTVLIMAAAAVEWVRRHATAIHPALGAAVVVAALVPPVMAITTARLPVTIEPFKPVLAYLQTHRQTGDAVYVYANAIQAVSHYGGRYGVPAGAWVPGICEANDVRAFLRDVDQFRGAPRVWVIGSNVPEFRTPRRAIGQYLRTIGVRRDSAIVPSAVPFGPVSAELFDLSDSTRLRSAMAATFAVPADTLHPLCFDWVRVAVR